MKPPSAAPPVPGPTAVATAGPDPAEAEQRYRTLVEQTPEGIVVHLDGRIVLANDAAARLLRADGADDLLGRQALDLIDPAGREVARERVARVLDGRPVTVLRQQVRRFDGSTVTVDLSGSLVHVGGRRAVQNVLHDVSPEQAAVEAVHRREQEHRTLFERSPVGIVECDASGALIAVNDAFAALLGRPAGELVGRRMRELARAADGEVRLAERIAAGEDAPAAERTFVRPDGALVQTAMSASVLRHPDGGVASTVVTVVDMTERNLARRELELLVAELQAARQSSEQRTALLDGVLDTIDVGVVACDANGRLTMFNGASRLFHGLPADPGLDPSRWAEHYDLRTEDGLLPLDPDQVPLHRALLDGQVHDAYVTIAVPGAPARVVRCDGRSLTGPDGQLLGAVVAMKDVTELRASEQRFRAAFHDGPTPTARLDADGTIVEANPALRRFLSVPTARLLGRRLLELVHPADTGALARALTGTGTVPVELRVLRADSTPVWCELATTAGRGPGGTASVLAQLLDIDARKDNELALERAASEDPLTGLGNRAVLDRELAALLDPSTDAGACVLFVDLDGFKAVNDRLGHDAGDHLLRELAGRLRAALRPGDTATRTGGDEFVVACALRGDPGERRRAAAGLTDRVQRALSEPVVHDGRPVPVAASVGTAVSRPGEDAASLVARADQAMYARKAERRRADQPVARPAGAAPRPRRGDDDQVRALLRTAVAHDRLRLQYQPVMDVRTGLVVGTEALMRLVDDDGRLVAPDRFIPVAEADGSIAELGRWAMREALTQTCRWKQQLEPGREFGIGVNISPQQLHDPNLVVSVEHALSVSGLDPAAVVLEITEGRLLADSPQVHEVMSALVGLGVHLAVDDFGTGFAGVGYLEVFPFDILKLDRRYTAQLTADTAAGRLARGLFALAEHTGLVTIAEGVETPEQAAAVQAAGCSLAQGYLWHRPTDPEALTAVLLGSDVASLPAPRLPA